MNTHTRPQTQNARISLKIHNSWKYPKALDLNIVSSSNAPENIRSGKQRADYYLQKPVQ